MFTGIVTAIGTIDADGVPAPGARVVAGPESGGSITDLTFVAAKKTSVEEINDLVRKAAAKAPKTRKTPPRRSTTR